MKATAKSNKIRKIEENKRAIPTLEGNETDCEERKTMDGEEIVRLRSKSLLANERKVVVLTDDGAAFVEEEMIGRALELELTIEPVG